MATNDTLGFMSGSEEHHKEADLKEVAQGLAVLTSDIATKLAPEIGRLLATTEQHTARLNELGENVGRLDRNLNTLQAAFRRVINKVVEQEKQINDLNNTLATITTTSKKTEKIEPTVTKEDMQTFQKEMDDVGTDLMNIFGDFKGTVTDIFKSVKTTTIGKTSK